MRNDVGIVPYKMKTVIYSKTLELLALVWQPFIVLFQIKACPYADSL